MLDAAMPRAKIKRTIFLVFSMMAAMAFANGSLSPPPPVLGAQPSSKYKGYTGSVSCRECHEKFYKLWAPSHHGLAMQPFTDKLAKKSLTPQTHDISIGDYRYRAEIQPGKGWVLEHAPRVKKSTQWCTHWAARMSTTS